MTIRLKVEGKPCAVGVIGVHVFPSVERKIPSCTEASELMVAYITPVEVMATSVKFPDVNPASAVSALTQLVPPLVERLMPPYTAAYTSSCEAFEGSVAMFHI